MKRKWFDGKITLLKFVKYTKIRSGIMEIKRVIVNGTKKPWRNEEGFVIMGMKYFLLNEDSLEF